MAKPHFTNSPTNIIEEIIRVNHAGEYGAKRIYQGQLNYTKNSQEYNTIKLILEQEEEHLQYFTDLLIKRNIRPTILLSLWHYIGYIMGSSSILLGAKFAMLLTQAVEEVIEKHYQQQIDYLSNYNIEPNLLSYITKFQRDEIEHKEIAFEHGSEEILFAALIKKIIKLKCQLAIILSKKI